MKKLIMSIFLALACLFVYSNTYASEVKWLTDFEEAQKIAKETTELHLKEDVPKAEELLSEELQTIEDPNINKATK